MILKNTLRYGFYAAVVTIILALTGIFGKLDERMVIARTINLSFVLLAVVLVGSGSLAAAQAKGKGLPALFVNGVIGSVIVGGGLALLMLLENSINLTFVFPELNTDPITPILTFGQELLPGLALLLVVSVLLGIVSALLYLLPARGRQTLILSLGITVVIGLLETQVNQIITLADSLALALVFGIAYVAALRFGRDLRSRLLIGGIVGLAAGLVLGLIAAAGGLEVGGFLRGAGIMPRILGVAGANILGVILIFGVVGAVGALISSASPGIHNGAIYGLAALVMLGVLNWQTSMTYVAALLSVMLLAAAFWFTPELKQGAEARHTELDRDQQRTVSRLSALVGLLLLLVAPAFLGQYITSVFDLVGLYVIMGIGLNVIVGYAGLLNLGYVAFFALGAYTVGILTTPSLLTCGGADPFKIAQADVPTLCTGMLTFWQAWPFAILVSALAGLLLGIPVLRLRGDYLAIVTLGFGEIIRLLTLSNDLKPLLGGAQGIARIPSPVIDLTFINPAWRLPMGNALNIYYVILAAVLVSAFIALRLSQSRMGRAWRAIRADEDVARAMGINLVQSKLAALAIGTAFAGMGGAIFGSWLQGIFPNSFTLLVSINVLSLIIIGGLGSIPGVVLGALVLLGLPEVLRELQDYRLLAFGVLLVATMLMKPDGLIPPPVRQLAETAAAHRARQEA